ncbi:hypothetical protein GmHk_01G001177 [Glycine max]|nr:hypothetical protein GmHk_01G001177 [Glycine max]
MGRIKRILRLCRFEFFDKGDTKEFRRLVLCSFGKGRRETQKEFRRLVLGEFLLAKGEGNEKMNSTSFQGLENQKNFGKLLAQRRRRRRSSKRFKACKEL